MKTANDLPKILSGPIRSAQRIVVYGPEGIGKSTLASLFPKPLFLDCEGGTKQLDIDRIEVNSMEDIKRSLALGLAGPYDTIVVDTADWCERIVITDMLRRDGHQSIEDYGYGKGYTEAQNQFAKLLSAFTVAINAGIHIVLLAHAQVIKFEKPGEAQPFDRWQLKLTKKSLPLLKEWSDMLLFLDWDVRVATNEKTKKSRGVGGKTRLLHTQHSATFDSKNRHQLPEKIAWDKLELPPEIAKAIEIDASTTSSRLEAIEAEAEKKIEAEKIEPIEIEGNEPLSAGELADKARKDLGATEETSKLSPALQKFHSEIVSHCSEALINDFLIDRGEINVGETWHSLTNAYALKAASHRARFIEVLLEFREKKKGKPESAGATS